MIDHVSARCDRFRLLFPTRNIESIVPLSGSQLGPLMSRPRTHASVSQQAHGHVYPGERHAVGTGAEYAVDLRHLLSGRPPAPQPSCIRLEWVSTDAERRVALIVDSVDEIVNSPHGQLERLPLLPKRLLALCDGVYHNPDGTYRVSVKLDVVWPMTPFSEGRHWRNALVTLLPETASSPLPA
jgi:hypothetical protein